MRSELDHGLEGERLLPGVGRLPRAVVARFVGLITADEPATDNYPVRRRYERNPRYETERQITYALSLQVLKSSGIVSMAWTSQESLSLLVVNGAVRWIATLSST